MTPEDAALCERLKKVVSRPSMAGGILRVKKSEVTTWLAAIERLSAENEALREAAEPFVSFAENVDENGWTSNIHKERVSYWFGPSDFRNIARTTLKGADQ